MVIRIFRRSSIQHRAGCRSARGQIEAAGALTAQQRQSIAALQANTAPGLIYAYGEPDSHRGSERHRFHGLGPRHFADDGARRRISSAVFLGNKVARPAATQ